MHFEILGNLTDIETIATGSGIQEVARLRKRKGNAEVRLGSGEIVRAEVHW